MALGAYAPGTDFSAFASRTVHSLATTAANEADIHSAAQVLHGEEKTAHLDAGYTGADKREDIVKNIFSHRKTRCQGLAKNTAHLHVLFAPANLVIARLPLSRTT